MIHCTCIPVCDPIPTSFCIFAITSIRCSHPSKTPPARTPDFFFAIFNNNFYSILWSHPPTPDFFCRIHPLEPRLFYAFSQYFLFLVHIHPPDPPPPPPLLAWDHIHPTPTFFLHFHNNFNLYPPPPPPCDAPRICFAILQ